MNALLPETIARTFDSSSVLPEMGRASQGSNYLNSYLHIEVLNALLPETIARTLDSSNVLPEMGRASQGSNYLNASDSEMTTDSISASD